jgi:hypothetical protein
MPAKGKPSNNPKGRPANERSLTVALREQLNQEIEVDGKKITGKQAMAVAMYNAVVTGRLKFPKDTGESVLAVRDWLDLAKWVYQYLEPPITKAEVTGADGEPLIPAKMDLSGLSDEELALLEQIRSKIPNAQK